MVLISKLERFVGWRCFIISTSLKNVNWPLSIRDVPQVEPGFRLSWQAQLIKLLCHSINAHFAALIIHNFLTLGFIFFLQRLVDCSKSLLLQRVHLALLLFLDVETFLLSSFDRLVRIVNRQRVRAVHVTAIAMRHWHLLRVLQERARESLAHRWINISWIIRIVLCSIYLRGDIRGNLTVNNLWVLNWLHLTPLHGNLRILGGEIVELNTFFVRSTFVEDLLWTWAWTLVWLLSNSLCCDKGLGSDSDRLRNGFSVLKHFHSRLTYTKSFIVFLVHFDFLFWWPNRLDSVKFNLCVSWSLTRCRRSCSHLLAARPAINAWLSQSEEFDLPEICNRALDLSLQIGLPFLFVYQLFELIVVCLIYLLTMEDQLPQKVCRSFTNQDSITLHE